MSEHYMKRPIIIKAGTTEVPVLTTADLIAKLQELDPEGTAVIVKRGWLSGTIDAVSGSDLIKDSVYRAKTDHTFACMGHQLKQPGIPRTMMERRPYKAIRIG